MGSTASSEQRDSGCEAAAEQRTAAAADAAHDTLLQSNGQVSSLNLKTKNSADEVPGQERILSDEDGTETTEDLQDVVFLQPNTMNEGRDTINTDGITVTEETMEIEEVNNINEVGFKKVFRFVGFKFTLKKDTCEKTEGEGLLANDQEERAASTSEDSSDAKETSIMAANENSLCKNTPEELLESETSVQPEAAEPSQKTKNERELDPGTRIVEHEITPEKEQATVVEASPESEEPMSPFKQFFMQGIFGSLRKKKKEDEIPKETKEKELTKMYEIDVDESERAEKVDSKCMCLDLPYIMYEEEKDSQHKESSKLLPEGELQHSPERDKVQGSPLKKLFRKFSTRRHRESKAAENVIESGDKVTEQLESSLEMAEVQKAEEPVVGEPKPAAEEQMADVSPQESKKKSDSSVSWEALICGSSAKKRPKRTNEGDTPCKGDKHEKTTESPLGSSTEGDYDHLTSSNEQDGEAESTWKTFKKMVTPKRKVRSGESSSSEHIPSDSENNKDDTFSMKKLLPGLKKRKSDGRQEQTSSDETGKDADEDDETPAIIPLSEYEIIEPESVKEVNEKLVEITIEHKMPEATSQELERDIINESKLSDKVSNNAKPLIIRVLSEDFEELTEFLSKQQLSDIPEEGIIEESVETPVSSAEWTTQDDTLAEDIIDLTADAVTAPEPASEELTGDNFTEMVSAVSQLTESPRTSGEVTPVSAENDVQMSNVILQEAVQSICMIPSVPSVTTKGKSQESLSMSFSPYIIHSNTPGETNVLVAHMKTEATAICTGLVCQELESVEELLSAPLVEAIPEISDAVLTELVSDNLTEALEVARPGTDEVYEAKILEVKTKGQEVIIKNTEEETATETKVDVEQVIQELPKPLMKVSDESQVVHMVDKNMEPVTDIELTSVQLAMFDTMQSEAVLDKVISENIQKMFRKNSENVNGQTLQCTEVTAEVEKELEIPDTPKLEDKAQIEEVKLKHVDVSEIQVDIKDAILNTAEPDLESVPEELTGGLAVIVENIGEKMAETSEEKIVQQETKDMSAEQSREVVASHFSETAAESLAKVQLTEDIASHEVSLPEKVLVEEAERVDKVTAELEEAKEIDTDADNMKVEESASDEVETTEKEKPAVREGLFTDTESDESENQEVSAHTSISKVTPEITEQDLGMYNAETAHAITVSEISEDVYKEISTEPKASSDIILTHLESVVCQDEARGVDTECSLDTEHSQETTAAITENTTKQSETEKPSEIKQDAQALSELPKAEEQEKSTSTMTEISTETKGAQQMDQAGLMTATEIKEKAVLEQKDKILLVTELEPGSSEPTVTEETVTAVSRSVTVAQNDGAVQIENNSLSKQMDGVSEETGQQCETLEQLIDAQIEVHVEKAEIKDEIPAVMCLKDEASDVTTQEVVPIDQLPPLTTPEVSVPEIQARGSVELKAATLEMTESKIEMPMETQVPEDTAVVSSVSIEMPVETQVPVDTAVVTEVGVKTSAVTSVVAERKVETPLITSLAETVDTHDFAVTSQSQNTDEAQPVDPVADVEMVETPAVSSVKATEAANTVESTANVMLAETSAVSPVVETPGISIISVKSTVDPMEQTSANETPAIVSVTATEAVAPGLVLPAGTPVQGTLFVRPAVEPPAIETAAVVEPLSVESPAVIPIVSAVSETSLVTPVVEIPGLVSAMAPETASPVDIPAVPARTETLARNICSTLVETTDFTPVVQTPALVSVTAEEAAAMTVVVETSAVKPPSNPTADTPVINPEVTTLPAVSVEKTPVVTLTEETPVVDGLIETSAGTSVPPQVTPEGQTPAIALVVMTPAVSPVIETSGVIPLVKESMLQVVEQEKIETKTEPSVKAEDDVKLLTEKEVKTPVFTEECILNEDSVKGSSQQVPMVTSTEPQSEDNDDVWEDAVDSTGDGHCLMTLTDNSAKQVSDPAV